MIDFRIEPRCRGVALVAASREFGHDVRRIRGGLKILHVATFASGGGAHKLAIDVAGVARYADMRAIERKVSESVVVEFSAHPTAGIDRVASRAIQGEVGGLMRWILRPHEIIPMACNTFSA